MTDSERVKEALAALANGEGETASESNAGAGKSLARPTVERDAVEQSESATTKYRTVIERAAAATADVEAAAQFVEEVGLGALEAAVRAAEREVSGLATEGREALSAFEQFRAAADGEDVDE